MNTSLKQKIILFFCSIQLFLFIVSQAPFLDLTVLGKEAAAEQMSFSFGFLNKLRTARSEENLFNKFANHYYSTTLLGYPSYYFFLGAPKEYLIYSFELKDQPTPVFSTCPLSWKECLDGKIYSDHAGLPLFEIMMISDKTNQDWNKKIRPQYLMNKYWQNQLKHESSTLEFVAYEQPVHAWFNPAPKEFQRRVINVAD